MAASQTAVSRSKEIPCGTKYGGFNYPRADAPPYTLGPTVGVVFSDHLGVRIEAFRRRFSFDGEGHFLGQLTEQSSMSGEAWLYPVLVAYYLGFEGPFRVSIGGGPTFASIGGTKMITSINSDQTTTTRTEPLDLGRQFALSFAIGGDVRMSFLTMRPEARLSKRFAYRHPNHGALFSPAPSRES